MSNHDASTKSGGSRADGSQHQRLKPRYAANLEVLVYTKGLDHFFAERTANISNGGLFVCTNYQTTEGEKLHIRIILSDIDSYFEVKTRVAWVCPGDGSHPAGLGLEFTELNEAQRTVIERILSKYINVRER
jgi:uncharacterized protein (TIGR02266 family)